MKLLKLCVTALLAPVALGASAPKSQAMSWFYSGNDVQTQCEKANTGFCYGYIAGMMDTFAFMQFPYSCPPDDITLGQVHDVVTNYLDEHPENRQEMGPYLAASALSEAWPCK